MRRRFAAPALPPTADGSGGVASAADRLGLLDGPAAGAGCVAPAARADVEASAGPARDRDLVVLVAMLHVVWCCNCKLGFWAVRQHVKLNTGATLSLAGVGARCGRV